MEQDLEIRLAGVTEVEIARLPARARGEVLDQVPEQRIELRRRRDHHLEPRHRRPHLGRESGARDPHPIGTARRTGAGSAHRGEQGGAGIVRGVARVHHTLADHEVVGQLEPEDELGAKRLLAAHVPGHRHTAPDPLPARRGPAAGAAPARPVVALRATLSRSFPAHESASRVSARVSVGTAAAREADPGARAPAPILAGLQPPAKPTPPAARQRARRRAEPPFVPASPCARIPPPSPRSSPSARCCGPR